MAASFVDSSMGVWGRWRVLQWPTRRVEVSIVMLIGGWVVAGVVSGSESESELSSVVGRGVWGEVV